MSNRAIRFYLQGCYGGAPSGGLNVGVRVRRHQSKWSDRKDETTCVRIHREPEFLWRRPHDGPIRGGYRQPNPVAGRKQCAKPLSCTVTVCLSGFQRLRLSAPAKWLRLSTP